MTKEPQIEVQKPKEDRIDNEEVFNQFFSDTDNTRLPSPYFSAVIAIICLAVMNF